MIFTDNMNIASAEKSSCLRIIQKLIERFEANRIKYCHWKSNEHLHAAISGDTDLDILFDNRQKAKIVKILKDEGYIRFKARWYIKYPYIEDYLSIDDETGKLVHVHAHFGLIIGEKRLKNYHLPWEDKVLDTRVYDFDYKMFRIDPCYELLLLFIRLSIKMNKAERGKFSRAYQSKEISGDALREFLWLKDRVSNFQLQEIGKASLGARSVEPLLELYDRGISRKRLQLLLACCASRLNMYRRYGKFTSFIVRIARNAGYLMSRFNHKFSILDLPVHRTALGKGLLITLMGTDGSGKSTQFNIIQEILSAKIDVLGLYMGSGDGAAGSLRGVLIVAKKFINKLRKIDHEGNAGGLRGAESIPATGKQNVFIRAWRILWAVSLALEKKAKINRAERAKSRGMFVICDRYPQNSIQGYNDGPLLQSHNGKCFRVQNWLSRWELKCFSDFQKISPDLSIKLLADSNLLKARRPEMNIEYIEKKQAGIRALNFPKKTKVVEIDAALPVEHVTAQIMNAIKPLFMNLD